MEVISAFYVLVPVPFKTVNFNQIGLLACVEAGVVPHPARQGRVKCSNLFIWFS
jgi:hypothetical protein